MVEYRDFQIPTCTDDIPGFDKNKEVTKIELKGKDEANISSSLLTCFIEDDETLMKNQQVFKNMVDNYYSSLSSLDDYINNLNMEEEFKEGHEALKSFIEENSNENDEENNE